MSPPSLALASASDPSLDSSRLEAAAAAPLRPATLRFLTAAAAVAPFDAGLGLSAGALRLGGADEVLALLCGFSCSSTFFQYFSSSSVAPLCDKLNQDAIEVSECNALTQDSLLLSLW